MPLVLALPAVDILLDIIAALIIYFAFVELQKVIAWFMPGFHIPGLGSIRDWVVNASEAVFHKATGWVDAAIGEGWKLAAYPVVFVRAILGEITSVASRIYWSFVALARVYLPALEARVTETARTFTHTAEALADKGVAEAKALAQTLEAEAVDQARTFVHTAEALADQGVADAKALAAAGVAEAEALAQHLYGDTISRLQALAATVTATEADLAAKLAAYADRAAHDAAAAATAALGAATVTDMAGLWQGIITDVDSALDVAGQDFTDVRDALQSIPRTIGADVPATIAAVGALSLPLLRLARECTMPNCRNLSGLGNLLADLFSAGTDAALVAMLAELVHDPAGAAHDIAATLGPIANDTVELAKTLVGVS